MSNKKCAVVLLGPPGSGKTTLGRGLVTRLPMTVIETGNLLEKKIRDGTPLGEQIKSCKAAGELVPSEVVKQVIAETLQEVRSDIVLFDGFPRSLGQMEMFFQLLRDNDLVFRAVIVLKVDLATATERLSARRVCSQCGAITNVPKTSAQQTLVCSRCGAVIMPRVDDRPEVMAKRFAIFERETQPVVDAFKRDFGHLTWEEPATTTPEDLAERVSARLSEAIARLGAQENHVQL